jgi:hypothetical protein
VKIASICIAVTGVVGMAAAPALLGALGAGNAGSQAGAATVSRTTKAVNYRRAGGSTKIDFQGTELMSGASGEAKVDSKSNRIEIEARFDGVQDSTKFGLEYLTYVLWAVSPQGRAVNLGEVAVKNGIGTVKAIADMQTFGMIVTAEPYYAVTQPGDEDRGEIRVAGAGSLFLVEHQDRERYFWSGSQGTARAVRGQERRADRAQCPGRQVCGFYPG